MSQLDFNLPEFMSDTDVDSIHNRMMKNLPAGIDNMPGGFPYDFTRPTAIEKSELINYHLARTLMIAFPQYAWDSWLDLHGQQVHLTRHPAKKATGSITLTGTVGAEITQGTIVCTPATEDAPAIQYITDEDCTISDEGTVTVDITAMKGGKKYNIPANTICILAKPNKNIKSVTNKEAITGGEERESNGDFYDRIAAEYENSMTFLGNDSDYVRWAKEAGAGDCIVVPADEGPGTVKLVLVDRNGQPANNELIEAVYNYIVSPNNRENRLLPTACAKLKCVSAVTIKINYTCTGLILDDNADIKKIMSEFKTSLLKVYDSSKKQGILRYNDIRPIISSINGVKDFDTFTINDKTENIQLAQEEYPETGTLNFLLAE